MINLWICLCICITVLGITVALILFGMPIITVVHKYEYPKEETHDVEKPIGFQPPAQVPEESKELSKQEEQERLLRDAVSTTALLLQGEVDIDDILER